MVRERARFRVMRKEHRVSHSVHSAVCFVVRVLECLVLHPRSLEAQTVGPDAHGVECGCGCGCAGGGEGGGGGESGGGVALGWRWDGGTVVRVVRVVRVW